MTQTVLFKIADSGHWNLFGACDLFSPDLLISPSPDYTESPIWA